VLRVQQRKEQKFAAFIQVLYEVLQVYAGIVIVTRQMCFMLIHVVVISQLDLRIAAVNKIS